MYKAITSFWSKSSSNKIPLSSESQIDEDSWIFVSDMDSSVMKNNNNNNVMTNSWIASPPLIKHDESSINVHHFNPIENLLIEHASMSVYDQIASKTRHRRQRKTIDDNKLDEQTEEEEDDDDDDDRTSINHQLPNVTSIHHRNMTVSSNSSITTLESSTSSLVAHHRHLHRLRQRRKRSNKSSSKLILTTSTDESKQVLNKNLERQRLNHKRTPKILIQQPSRSNH